MTKEEKDLMIEVAKEIYEIAKRSPEYGNALMDVLGEEKYIEIQKIAIDYNKSEKTE